jgi:hypothetical protein
MLNSSIVSLVKKNLFFFGFSGYIYSYCDMLGLFESIGRPMPLRPESYINASSIGDV